ncbi:MAG: 5-formyltetrahydrofolate cyclo-ligase [Phocaeicola sp.]
MRELKNALRKQIAERKKRVSALERAEQSKVLFQQLEQHPLFKAAQTVLLYYSLPDEVATHAFVEKWSSFKQILLPVVVGDCLELRLYTSAQNLKKSQQFSIGEPTGEPFLNYTAIDLAIIPGVAFDQKGNRLGRGKGFYDRLLTHLSCHTLGVCFSFQLVDSLPTEPFDWSMDEVWTEQGAVYSSHS